MAKQHSLALLPRALITAGYKPASYAQCYRAALNGTIPVSRGDNSRWFWSPDDLSPIAEGLGLSPAYAA